MTGFVLAAPEAKREQRRLPVSAMDLLRRRAADVFAGLRRWAVTLLCLTTVAATPIWAQDAVSGVFRETISQVASLAGWKDLRTDGEARREIRVYQGFGIAIPHSVVRLWEGQDGRPHVQTSYFWSPPPKGLAADEPDLEREFRTLLDTAFACTDLRRSEEQNLCVARESLTATEVEQLSSALWSLELDALRKPNNTSMGFDGWTVVVEYRRGREYRSASVWQPSEKSDDAVVRLVARVGELVSEAAERGRVRSLGH